MESLEVEVKFFLENHETLRRQILRLGAKSRGRVFERNITFELSDKELIPRNSLLRLRRDKRSTLTFKSEVQDPGRQFNIHRELTVEIDDVDAMILILESLGFEPAQRYEKWRETLELKNTCFCFDALPFGNFLEIEGPKQEIINWTHQIGLNWKERILLNYLAIFEIIKAGEKLEFSDITFRNFDGVMVDLERYLDRLRIDNA